MARADVREYYNQIEQQYNEIKEILEDVTEYYNKGEMTAEAAEDALHDFERAQLVYETAQIFMHKLSLPCAKTKKKRQEVLEIPKEFDDYLTEGEEKCKEV